MATTTSILVLLKFFASRQKNAVVNYTDFCEYLKRYSEHHLAEQPSLACYLEDPVPALQKELDKLSDSHQIMLVNITPDKQGILVIPFYIERFAERYRDISVNPSLPFPSEADLPKGTPQEILVKESAADLIGKLLKHQELNEKTLYGLILPHNAPSILLPSTISVVTLIEDAVGKIQNMLKKEEHHDYFLKKLTVSNPGREMIVKNFFNAFVDRPDHSLETLSQTTESFYLWNQLCFFIKQDYEKIKDYTQEDLSCLQAVYITEVGANYFKTEAQERAKKEGALKTLESHLLKPPYYFTFDEIIKFTDNKGVPLLGQYTEDELKDYLHKKTQEAPVQELPDLLVFKTYDDQRYFIFKSKVLPLILRLCTDARISVLDAIKTHWSEVLRQFDVLPEMKDPRAFEDRLEREIRIQSPILSALLHSSFLPLLSYDASGGDDTSKISLFVNDQLLPYSDILLMSRQELLNDAKIMLPFWYSMPLIAWIAKMLLRPPKAKRNKTRKTRAEIYHEEEETKRKEDETTAMIAQNATISKKVALREAARSVEQAYVPVTSTLNRELDSYEKMWNHRLGKETHNNLTEDVNSLIRDYIRRTLRTMKTEGFTKDRIESLAESLMTAPGLQKIRERDALLMYIKLYMVKLVKNIPM
ncbi:hypothetical protein [uncultured Treponema sp.]|uniref:hypothetical protein n=1 Tax=uncultured Treponema sp. TaxID=162155 RepID=UPI0025F1C050|nr:hypothetical protein [uncultured Treponema sp.]